MRRAARCGPPIVADWKTIRRRRRKRFPSSTGSAPSGHRRVLRTRRDRGLALPRRPRPSNRVQVGQLTRREVDVLLLLADGLSTADIADRLVLSPRTVEHHVSAVLRKLGEPTRARAVAAAHRLAVLPGVGPTQRSRTRDFVRLRVPIRREPGWRSAKNLECGLGPGLS